MSALSMAQQPQRLSGQFVDSSRPLLVGLTNATRSHTLGGAILSQARPDHHPLCLFRRPAVHICLPRACWRDGGRRRGKQRPAQTVSAVSDSQQDRNSKQQHRNSERCPQPRLGHWWALAARTALGAGLLLAAGIAGAARPAGAATSRHPDRGPCSAPTSQTLESSQSRWSEFGPLTGAERLATAAERSQAVSSSSYGSHTRCRWKDTGIELAEAAVEEGDEEPGEVHNSEIKEMRVEDFQKYLAKEFAGDPKYGNLFWPQKKPKKLDVMQTQVPDPASWDKPEFQPMTAWRTDRMKDLTYTQLWFLIKERKVDHVKFSRDHKTVLVTTKANAPGGRRTERVALPYDPDFYNHMIEHGVRVEIPEPMHGLETVIFGFMYLIWPMAVAVLLFVGTLNMRFSAESDEEKLFKGAQLDRLNEGQHKLSFADIAGIDNVKAEVEELVQFLRNPKRFIDLGAKAPAGVLLVGNPGTGKTLLAKAIAGEAGVPFLSVAGTEFDQLFVGVGAARVRDMFRQARESAPCILFIDEFDGVGKQRSLSAANESANTINSLLTELDGFEDNTGVIVMAATNRPSALDSALTRPGRFDRVLQLPLPSIDGREAILKVHARGKRMAKNVDYNKVARATGGYTGAQLMNVMNTAAIVSVRRGSTVITTDDLLTALENIRQERYTPAGGMLNEDDKAPTAVRRGIAVYEAARALIGTITPYYDEIAKVVCCPGGSTTGYTHFIPQEEQLESRVVTRAYMEAKMTVALAGRCAERLVLGEAHISTAGAGDLELANMIAREMVYKCGFSRRLGPVALMDSQTGFLRGQSANSIADIGTELAAIALTDIEELVQGAEAKASFGLAVNYQALQALVEALIEKEGLSGEQICKILDEHGAVGFPDPFVVGFGWDKAGNLIYPGMPEAAKQEEGDKAAKEQEQPLPSSSDMNGNGNGIGPNRVRKYQSIYPYRVRDDLRDLIGDELKVLERL